MTDDEAIDTVAHDVIQTMNDPDQVGEEWENHPDIGEADLGPRGGPRRGAHATRRGGPVQGGIRAAEGQGWRRIMIEPKTRTDTMYAAICPLCQEVGEPVYGKNNAAEWLKQHLGNLHVDDNVVEWRMRQEITFEQVKP
jgi:hypothetical protein